MSISEQIIAAEQSLTANRDTLTNLAKALDESPADADVLTAMDEANDNVEKGVAELARLRRVEQNLMAAAVPQREEVAVKASPAFIKSTSNLLDDPVNLIVANAVAAIESFETRMPIQHCLEARFGSDDRVKAVSGIVQKAAQPLAVTQTSGWAAELVREGYLGFMDLLAPASIVPNLPLNRFDFGSYGSVKVPMRADTPTLDAEFVGEGEAIPVKGGGFKSKTLTPKKMGVISHYTDELLQRSTPNILTLIRDMMVRDTAIKLDAAFLSNLAGTDIQPPGMQNLAGTPIDGSGMTTLDGTLAVLKAAVKEMASKQLGASPVWIMHPAVAMDLTVMTNAVGAPAFPTMANGSLLGIPVVTSTTCPADLIFLIDCAEIAFAGGAPRFLGSNVASIHEANPAAPLVQADGTAAAPVRSLYQTDSHALRAIWNVSWDQLREGSVIVINNVPA